MAATVLGARDTLLAGQKKLRQVFDAAGISLLLSQVFRGSFLK